MIDLAALKSYEETHIAPSDPTSQVRVWWNSLTFLEQLLVSERWRDGKDHRVDLNVANLNQETYGTNS